MTALNPRCARWSGGGIAESWSRRSRWPTPQQHNYKEPGAGHVARGGRRSDLTIAVKHEETSIPDAVCGGWEGSGQRRLICDDQPGREAKNTPTPSANDWKGSSRGGAAAGTTDGPGHGSDRGWWAVEPRLGRVANGVARRVDRLKAIGNGQVPAVVSLAWGLVGGEIE